VAACWRDLAIIAKLVAGVKPHGYPPFASFDGKGVIQTPTPARRWPCCGNSKHLRNHSPRSLEHVNRRKASVAEARSVRRRLDFHIVATVGVGAEW
jgi:hypothetical protein